MTSILIWAQTATGRLTGTVLDQSGAPIPGVDVTVKNQDTGLTVTAVTGDLGNFSVPSLTPGLYTVRVSLQSFQTFEAKDIKVDVGREYSLPPIKLQVGAPDQSVIVEAGAETVNTTNAEISQTVEREQIQRLPLNGRNPLELISLQAGTSDNARSNLTINGQRSSFTNIARDGINIQDNFIRSNATTFTPNLPFSEQVGEFTIATQNAGVDTGGGASQINIVTPSGTNQFRGSAFWYHRNDALASVPVINKTDNRASPGLIQNQFGGSASGPIFKDKLLFFSSFEGQRIVTTASRNRTVLSDAARRGIFTYRDAANPSIVRQADLLALSGLTLDPRTQALLQGVPTTINNFRLGDSDAGLTRNSGGYSFNQRSNRRRDNFDVRLDYNLSARSTLQTTYGFNKDLLDRGDADGGGYGRIPKVANDDHTHFNSSAWRWTPTARFTNEVRGGFNLAPGIFRTTEDFSSGFLLTGLSFSNPVANFRRQGRNTDFYTLKDNANWQRGTHTLKFGFDFAAIRSHSFNDAGTLPTYTLGMSPGGPDGNPFSLSAARFPGAIRPADVTAANALLATLAGIMSQADQTLNVTSRTSGFVPGAPNDRRFTLNNYSWYFGDTWRVNQKLTVTAGLRWEYFGRFDEKGGLLLAPVIKPGQSVVDTVLDPNGTIDFAGQKNKRPLYKKDLNNFAPNIGIAWDPFGNGKTAIRAGYSINYVNDESIRSADNASTGNTGLVATPSRTSLAQLLRDGRPTLTAQFMVPRSYLDNYAINPQSAAFAIDPNFRIPYVQQWNLSIQREVGFNTAVELRYVATKGSGLVRGLDYNQVIIRENGFLDDFLRARRNGFAALQRAGVFDPRCPSPNNPACESLTVFPRLLGGGLLTNSAIAPLIQRGEVGQLAAIYVINQLDRQIQRNTNGSIQSMRILVPFNPNPSVFPADVLQNLSSSTYHSGQAEVRRRFSRGLAFQANYTFSKVLTDVTSPTGAQGSDQTRFQPRLDNAQPRIEKYRADFDTRHIAKVNFIYDLPFGQDRHFTVNNGVVNRFISGWSMSSIFTWTSGTPFGFLSGRGTLNRRGRGNNTLNSTLTLNQIREHIGFYQTPQGRSYIDPAIIGPNNQLTNPDGFPPFPGQVFFHPEPGTVGSIQRNAFDGPRYFNWDFSLGKKTSITERVNLQFSADFFNLTNHPFFGFNGDFGGDTINAGLITSARRRLVQFGLRLNF
jgi:hypothetical protein